MPIEDEIKQQSTLPISGKGRRLDEHQMQKFIQDFANLSRFDAEGRALDYQGISPFNFVNAAYKPSAGGNVNRFSLSPLGGLSEADIRAIQAGEMKPYQVNFEEAETYADPKAKRKHKNLWQEAQAIGRSLKELRQDRKELIPTNTSITGLQDYIAQVKQLKQEHLRDIKGEKMYKNLRKDYDAGKLSTEEFVGAVKRNSLEKFTPGYYEDDAQTFAAEMDKQYFDNAQNLATLTNLAGELTGAKAVVRTMRNPGETAKGAIQTVGDALVLSTGLGFFGNDINPITGEKYFSRADALFDPLAFTPLVPSGTFTKGATFLRGATASKLNKLVSPKLYNSPRGVVNYFNQTAKNIRIESTRDSLGNLMYKMLKRDKAGNWKEVEMPDLGYSSRVRQSGNNLGPDEMQELIIKGVSKNPDEVKELLRANGLSDSSPEFNEIINLTNEIRESYGNASNLKNIRGEYIDQGSIRWRDNAVDEAFVRYNTGSDRDPFGFGSAEKDLEWRLYQELPTENRISPRDWKNLSETERLKKVQKINTSIRNRPDLYEPEVLIQNAKTLKKIGVSLPYTQWRKLGMIDNNTFLSGMLQFPSTSQAIKILDESVGATIDSSLNKITNLFTKYGGELPPVQSVQNEFDDIINLANKELEIGIKLGDKSTDVGIRLEKASGSATVNVKVNVDKFLKTINNSKVEDNFNDLIQTGAITLDQDGYFHIGRMNFKMPQQASTRELRTFSEILKGAPKKIDSYRIPGRPEELGTRMYGKAGDFPFGDLRAGDLYTSLKGGVSSAGDFGSQGISARTIEALKRGAQQTSGKPIITSGGTGHTLEGTARYLSGVPELGGKDLYKILAGNKKFLTKVNEIKKDPALQAELQRQIKEFKKSGIQGNLFSELKKLHQGTTYQIKKHGGSLNTNQFKLGSYMTPQDLNPETMQKYLMQLRELENAGKTGFKEGKWYPHESVEGGMPTIGYGHKVIQGEDFSKGLTEEEALALQEEDVLKHQAIAKERIDKKFGEGTFDSLPQDSQMLAVDYEYNGVLRKFPSFTKALVENDKEGMLKEYVRYTGGKPLGTRNTWTEGIIEGLEFEKGGSFNNAGFKSLPLPIQQKIMKGANKKELGGADTVDPAEVARLMKHLANYQRAGFDKTSAEQLYYPGSPEYQQALQEEYQRILSLNPTDHYLSADDGRDYSAENVYAAMKANPPAYYYNIDAETGQPTAMYNTPPSIKNVNLQQMPTPPVQTVPPGRDPGVRAANTGELMDRPLMFEGQNVDYTYKQYAEEFANDPARLQAAQEQQEIMDANRQALGTLTPEQQEEARKAGLTATEYLNQRTFGTKEGMSFANGGNIFAGGGMMNQYAMGAQMPQGQMTDIPTTEFNAGGSHEDNPMGGVYQGMASNGKPNVVEQGELKITIPGTDDQFIVSPKIKLDKATAEEFGLSKKHVGKDMVKIFKSLLRKNNFAEREGDSIVENSKQLEIMPYVAAHQKLTEIANAKDQAKKQEAFDKDMTQMMEKHPEYMQALMAQSQQPMQQQGPSPEEMAMMEQQGAMQGGMPLMMATYGGNISQATGGYMNYAQGGKMPKEVLRARAESHMSKEAADAYVNNYEYGTNMYAKGGMIRRADGSYSQRGLWDNIRANKGSGKEPTKEMLKQEKKIKANNKAYGSNMYGYGSNMYDFGADLVQGIGKGLQMAAPVLSKIPGAGPIAATVAGAGGAALENVGTGADLKEVLTDTAFGAAGGAASIIPGGDLAVGALENIYDANNVSASEEALMQENIAKYGGKKYKYGNILKNGDGSEGDIENLDTSGGEQQQDEFNLYYKPYEMAMMGLPVAANLYQAFKKEPDIKTPRLNLTVPKIDTGELTRGIERSSAAGRKALRNAGPAGYKSSLAAQISNEQKIKAGALSDIANKQAMLESQIKNQEAMGNAQYQYQQTMLENQRDAMKAASLGMAATQVADIGRLRLDNYIAAKAASTPEYQVFTGSEARKNEKRNKDFINMDDDEFAKTYGVNRKAYGEMSRAEQRRLEELTKINRNQ
jgi:hypothetical protein